MKFVDNLVPFVRLALFLMVMAAAVFVLFHQTVQADPVEALLRSGAELMEYLGAPQEPVRDLELNGVTVSFRSQTVDAPIDVVLDHYESICAARNAGLVEQLSAQVARTDDAGYIACLDTGGTARGLPALAQQFLRFSVTGNLAELGGLLYARAHSVSGASGPRTFLFTMWSDGALDLFGMLPSGWDDATGSDVEGVPRPTGSQRILSATETGKPSGLVVYRLRGNSPSDLESFYRAELLKRGWSIIERHPSESISIDGIRMLAAEQGNRLVTVLVEPREASETILTILTSEPT